MADQESAMASAIQEHEQLSKKLSKIAAAHEYDMEKAAIEKEKAAIAHGFKQNAGAMRLLEQQEARTRDKETRLRERMGEGGKKGKGKKGEEKMKEEGEGE